MIEILVTSEQEELLGFRVKAAMATIHCVFSFFELMGWANFEYYSINCLKDIVKLEKSLDRALVFGFVDEEERCKCMIKNYNKLLDANYDPRFYFKHLYINTETLSYSLTKED